MSRLFAATATAIFCAGFAFVVDAITDALAAWQVVTLAALSGFLGSLFGNSLLGMRRK
ncbi:MAG: hypothetical protein AAGH73_10890 [Pseudomonadota bacterium]